MTVVLIRVTKRSMNYQGAFCTFCGPLKVYLRKNEAVIKAKFASKHVCD